MKTSFLDSLFKLESAIKRKPSISVFDQEIRPYIQDNTLCRYFYASIATAEWFSTLLEVGEFDSVSQPDKSTGQFPSWPQVQFLRRMTDDCPEMVLDAMLRGEPGNHGYVRNQYIEIATALPVDLCAQWARTLLPWLDDSVEVETVRPESLADLVVSLMNSPNQELGRSITKAYLSLLPTDTDSDSEEGLTKRIKTPAHYYKQFFESMLPRVENAQFFEIIADALSSSVAVPDFESSTSSYIVDDSSNIWCPAVENNEQNRYSDDYRFYLTHALRDVCSQWIEVVGEKVLCDLEDRKHAIFWRISVYLRHLYPNIDTEKTLTMITDENLATAQVLWHEFYGLLKSCFPQLSEAKRGEYLEIVERSFDQDGRWYRHMHPVYEYLDKSRKEKFDRLKLEIENLPEGQEYHPDFHIYTGAWFRRDRGPQPIENLETLSICEILKEIRNFEPDTQTHGAPNHEGFAQDIGSIASRRLEDFSSSAISFANLNEDIYLYRILSAFETAAREKKHLDWPEVLKLCKLICEREILDSEFQIGSYVELKRVRQAIGDLLEKGLQEYKESIPIGERDNAWAIIEQLANHPDPTNEYETRTFSSSTMDPATLVINTVRGRALMAAMRYGLWVFRHFEKSEDIAFTGRTHVRELFDLLDRKLDPGEDSTKTTRAFFGMWLPWIVVLDEIWAKDNIERIFGGSVTSHRDVAWQTYLCYCQVYGNVVPLVMPFYERAVETWTRELEIHCTLGDAHNNLARHIMVLYWWDKIGLDNGGLLDVAFCRGDTAFRHSLLQAAVPRLEDGGEIPAQVPARLQLMWDWWVEKSVSDENPELSAFGNWFLSSLFDEEWRMQQLEMVVTKTKNIDRPDDVLEVLTKRVTNSPAQTISITTLLVRHRKELWLVEVWKEYLIEIIKNCLGHDESKDQAEELIDYLCSQGYIETYRKLLPNG